MAMMGSPLTSKELQQKLETELHALAQPLMSLQCRLEIGRLMPGESAARAAISESMVQLDRVLQILGCLRDTAALHGEALAGAEL